MIYLSAHNKADVARSGVNDSLKGNPQVPRTLVEVETARAKRSKGDIGRDEVLGAAGRARERGRIFKTCVSLTYLKGQLEDIRNAVCQSV